MDESGLGDVVADGVDGLAVIEEEDALVPRDRDHDAKAEFLREVEEPARRGVVDAQDVDAELAHEAEVDGDLLRRGEIDAALGRGAERAVGDALEIELVFALKEKLGPDLEPGEINRGSRRRGNYVMHGAEFPRGGGRRQVRNERLLEPILELKTGHPTEVRRISSYQNPVVN